MQFQFLTLFKCSHRYRTVFALIKTNSCQVYGTYSQRGFTHIVTAHTNYTWPHNTHCVRPMPPDSTHEALVKPAILKTNYTKWYKLYCPHAFVVVVVYILFLPLHTSSTQHKTCDWMGGENGYVNTEKPKEHVLLVVPDCGWAVLGPHPPAHTHTHSITWAAPAPISCYINI